MIGILTGAAVAAALHITPTVVLVPRPDAVKTLLPGVTTTTFPGPSYYLTMAGGFAVALLVVLATLPLLGRITQPERVRFE